MERGDEQAVRMGELSRRTEVPIPTIKYYLREGLLAPGRLTGARQAVYDDAHVHRLRLIRALIDVGGLSVAAVGAVLDAAGDPSRSPGEVVGAAAEEMASGHGGGEDLEAVAAHEAVERFVGRRGWQVPVDDPAARDLTRALAALERVGHGDFETVLDTYADAAEHLTRADLEYVSRGGPARQAQSAVVATVLGEAVFGAVRRMTQVDASAPGRARRQEHAATAV